MLNLLQKHLKLIISWGVIFALLSVLVSVFFPPYYSATTQVLIISRDRSGVDPYTQVKSAERIGENLAQVMKTTDFMNKVMSSGTATFDKTRWQGLTDRKLRKQWQRDVEGTMAYGSSLLNIKTFGRSQDDAKALAAAVTDTVSSRGWEYVGGDVAIKVVNDPLVSSWPTRPNNVMNAGVGLVLGLLLSSWWVLRYKKHLFGNL